MKFHRLVKRCKGVMSNPSTMTESPHAQYMSAFPGDTAPTKGVCFGMATLWVAQRANNKDYFKYVNTPNGRNLIRQLQDNHEHIGVVKGIFAREESRSKGVVARFKNAFNLGSDNKFQEIQDVAGDLIDNRTAYDHQYIQDNTNLQGTRTKHAWDDRIKDVLHGVLAQEGYVMFNFTGATGGGHTTALFASPRGGVRFFDPNYGEAYFESVEKCSVFLMTLAADVYGDLNGQPVRATIDHFPATMFPTCPEDKELPDRSYLSMSFAYIDCLNEKTRRTVEEMEQEVAATSAPSPSSSSTSAGSPAAATSSPSS